MQVNLVDMKPGQSGIISAIEGGQGLEKKLSEIGLYRGRKVKKISSVFRRGPVTVHVDNFQVAIGYGKAVRVMVEVNNDA